MECSICYEKFLYPKNQEEILEIKKIFYKESKEKYEKAKLEGNKELKEKYLHELVNKSSILDGLIITDKHNLSYKCLIENCDSIICGDCLIRIKTNGKTLENMTDDDMDDKYKLIKCPYCRNTDFKDYLKNNVFEELLMKANKNNYLENKFKKEDEYF